LFGFGCGDLVIGSGGGDDVQQVGKFLNNLVGGGNQVMRMGNILRVLDEEPAGPLANPLNQPVIAGAGQQGFDL